MRVTFDFNLWEKVVSPEDYAADPKIGAIEVVNEALRKGRVSGFICETFATIEAIRKGERSSFWEKRSEDAVSVRWEGACTDPVTGKVQMSARISITGQSAAHTGLPPIQEERFRQAMELGFLLLPISRIGTVRPPIIDNTCYHLPLTAWQKENIWDFLDRISAISQAIEDRGAGFAQIEQIAKRIQRRHNLQFTPWYNGLAKFSEVGEQREIDRAFAEWADGDTVAVHIAYGLDALCTQDSGKSARASVFNAENRAWLKNDYALDIVDIETLASRL